MGAKRDEQQYPAIWPLPDQKRSPRRDSHPRPTPARAWIHWLRRLVIGLTMLAVICLVACGVFYWHLSATVSNYSGQHFNMHQNGVWLEHSWAGEPHGAADYDALAEQLA